ncbi:NAD(P)H-quinone oxidoreductase [Streptomyces sp. NPDC051976]|uniref:NAD(P)H-quinone oxidoreductase n=1 Tax=Streptomyces sp. NPDC051976 TaxID=3154947 RepID=UPI00342A69A3
MQFTRAVVAREPGGPEVLEVVEVARPVPGPGEVLIKVHAAGVNRADVYQRMGFYDPPAGVTQVLGLECAGEVVARGPGASAFEPGDRVCALLPGGGYADYVAAPEGLVARVPDRLTMAEAAGLMEAAATVWSNVFWAGGLQRGETLLIHGGASGIGTLAIQIAKAAEARIVVTAGSEAKLEACARLGADVTINYRDGDFSDHLEHLGLRADVVLDIMGGSYLSQNVRSLAVGGRLVVIGLQGGAMGQLDLGTLLAKRATVVATSLRARSLAEKESVVARTVAHVWPLIESGAVTPVIHGTFPLGDAAKAHQTVEESTHLGKVVLLMD